MSRRRVHAVVHGLVQGVFFRKYTSMQAHELGLSGWVRNRPDGTVESVFEGEDEAVSRMIQWLHSGSPNSEVTRVDETDQDAGVDSGEFYIRY